jgi:hypothetical protein
MALYATGFPEMGSGWIAQATKNKRGIWIATMLSG